jgi:hypothetical protein
LTDDRLASLRGLRLTPLRVAACVWAPLALWAGSSIAQSLLEVLMIAAGLYFFGVASAILLVRAFVLRWTRPSTSDWRSRAATAAVLLMAVVPVLLDDCFGLTWHARFRASEAALETFARNTKPGSFERGPRWIGLTRVVQIDTVGPAVRFLIGDCDINECGLVFSPDGEPARKGKGWYQHFTGPWWHWVQSW